MFELLFSNYRLPRAHYSNVYGQALLFDAKRLHIHLLRGTMVVQDEKSVHFRVMGGSYLSHDEKSISLRNITGSYIASDSQFNRHAAVSLSYMVEDQQSFSLFSIEGQALINDGNGGLYVARNFCEYVADDRLMKVGLVGSRADCIVRQEGRISPHTYGQIAIEALEQHVYGFVSNILECALTSKKHQFGVACIGGGVCFNDEFIASVSPQALVGIVAVQDKYIGSIFDSSEE